MLQNPGLIFKSLAYDPVFVIPANSLTPLLALEFQLHRTAHTQSSGRKSLDKQSHFNHISMVAANAPERSDKELHTHTHFYFNK